MKRVFLIQGMEGKAMKHIMLFISLLWALFMSMPLQAQTVKQQGVTYRYNGKNKRTPIGGVYIKPITAANGVVSDESNGAFTLAFDNLKMGSRIGNVRVTKQGMMVFNQQAVDEWSVRKDPLCLILCNADEFQKQKKNLIAIGESQAKKKYDKKLAELKKQNDAQQLTIDEYYNKLDSLEKEYQNALKHMDEYADVFARIDESEVDTVAQRAIEMFNRGEIEESIHLLEQQNYMEKIKQANRTIEQADALISTAEHSKSLAEQDKEKYIEGVKTQIAGYKLQNEWNKAKELLKGLADNLNTYDAICDYVRFCENQKDFNEAEAYCLKCKEQLEKDNEIEENEKIRWLIVVLVDLGHIYYRTQRYEKCETVYMLASENYQCLASSTPYAYETIKAAILNGLAVLYYETLRYDESESIYKSALEINERLAESDPSFESNVAKTLNNLAALYKKTERYSESESMFKSALEIRNRLAMLNPSIYESEVAETQLNLGILYKEIKRYSESETMYKAALEIFECLAKTNPSAYEPDFVQNLHGLADLYFKTQRYSDSETFYKSALEVYERLEKDNPSAYLLDIAIIKTVLADFYNKTKRYSESEQMYKAALDNYIVLAKSDSLKYYPNVALIQNVLGIFYSNSQRYRESEVMYKSALEIYERLAQTNPSQYTSMVADNQHILAFLYSDTKRYLESEKMYELTIQTYLKLHADNPKDYEKPLMECFYWLGRIRLLIGKSNEAQDSFQQSLNLARQMYKRGTEAAIYWEILYFLSDIMNNEKDYVSAYSYIEELLPLLKVLYVDNCNKYKNLISGKLISQSYYANLLGKFSEGEHCSLEALKVDSTKHLAYTNLAAAYLFLGKVEEAEELYMQYKVELKEGFLSDFAEFERFGVIPEERKKDVERIKAMLNEP